MLRTRSLAEIRVEVENRGISSPLMDYLDNLGYKMRKNTAVRGAGSGFTWKCPSSLPPAPPTAFFLAAVAQTQNEYFNILKRT